MYMYILSLMPSLTLVDRTIQVVDEFLSASWAYLVSIQDDNHV